uniref:hypothetical protein n=1 Tax=Tenacibaculum mesophilum TaxID=104268 RepID=UPI00064A2FE0
HFVQFIAFLGANLLHEAEKKLDLIVSNDFLLFQIVKDTVLKRKVYLLNFLIFKQNKNLFLIGAILLHYQPKVSPT